MIMFGFWVSWISFGLGCAIAELFFLTRQGFTIHWLNAVPIILITAMSGPLQLTIRTKVSPTGELEEFYFLGKLMWKR